jgi:two-component system response regulator FlrC
MDGISLLRRAKDEQPEMQVIVLTAYGSVETAVEAMRLGAFDYLQKPLGSPAELRLLTSRAIEHKRLVTHETRTTRDAPSTPPLSYGDPAMVPVVEALQKVASTNATVLLTGESGTGKEIAARTVHQWSRRSGGPFVAVNCAAMSETLIESELFGHEKGAFTGATAARPGRIELADGGTLFLDEIAELKPALQVKLLRVLQERTFERVGGTRTIQADVRWVAATNRNLDAMLKEGSFREDLYHRIAVFPIQLPPLRERPGDIIPLSEAILERIAIELGRPGLSLSEDAKHILASSGWPGNVRELSNSLERAAILASGGDIQAEYLASQKPSASPRGSSARTLAELEREAVEDTLREVGGNRRMAAERLGIGLRTLYDKLKQYSEEEGPG